MRPRLPTSPGGGRRIHRYALPEYTGDDAQLGAGTGLPGLGDSKPPPVKLDRVVGIGAPAAIVIRGWHPAWDVRICYPAFSRGQSLGAVVARPTLQLTLHADTQTGTYSTDGQVKNFRWADPDEGYQELSEKELKFLAEEKGWRTTFPSGNSSWRNSSTSSAAGRLPVVYLMWG